MKYDFKHFPLWLQVVQGFSHILDGVVMVLSLGFVDLGLSVKVCEYKIMRRIRMVRNERNQK